MFSSSQAGVVFTRSHEGTVTRAYKDPGGVVTIGNGFTNLSPICRSWFIVNFGHPLQMGDKMTEAQCDTLLHAVLDHECSGPANSLLPANQQAYDAEVDVIYNCGPNAVGWNWAQAAKAQQYPNAAALLRVTAIKAAGVPNAGLRVRRAAEADLLVQGEAASPVDASAAETLSGDGMRSVQRSLNALGYYKGAIDGLKGPLTIGAIKNFQRAYGLKVDGAVGPATRSALARAMQTKTGQNYSLTGGGGVGGVGWLTSNLGIHLDNPWVIVGCAVAVVILIYVAFLLWSHRGVLLGKRTPA